MTITLQANQLRALARCAAEKNYKPHLARVAFENDGWAMSTDGHIMMLLHDLSKQSLRDRSCAGETCSMRP